LTQLDAKSQEKTLGKLSQNRYLCCVLPLHGVQTQW